MNKAAIAVVVTTCCLAPIAACASTKPVDSAFVPSGYSLVWDDEFDKDGLPDPQKWGFNTFSNTYNVSNGELQYYAKGRKENIFVKDGHLNIVVRKEDMSGSPDYKGQHYSSAEIETKNIAKWTYGYFEIRAKVPCGAGTWPAIWMVGANGRWPAFGEIDIMEHLGKTPGTIYGTIHDGRFPSGMGSHTQIPDACQNFHLYQMTWTPEEIDIAVDGVRYDTYLNGRNGHDQWPFAEPQYFLLNVAMGGGWAGPVDDTALPQTFVVDYVRVYQKK